MSSTFVARSIGSLKRALMRDLYAFSPSVTVTVTVGVLTVELGSDAVRAVLL
jgi:hypothetical protein